MPKDDFDLKAVSEAVADVSKGFEELKNTMAEKDKEMLTKGSFDTLLGDKLTRINEALDEKQALIDKLHVAVKRKSVQIDGQNSSPEEVEKKAATWFQMLARRKGSSIEGKSDAEAHAEYKNSFGKYLRKDDKVLNAEESKALSVGSDPDGGYVVDADTSGRMVTRLFETSEIRAYASTQVITTDALEGMYDLDDVSFGWVGETGERTETTTPTLGAWRIPVHEMYAEPRATQKIVDDMAIDLEGWVARKIADKFSRAENAAFVSGNGIAKPRGFLDYAAGSSMTQEIERFYTGADGAFAAAPSGADVLINMIHSMKAQYRRNGVFAMNRTTMGGLRLLKDSEGRMLWQPSIAVGMPSTLLGYPVASFEDMPSYTTTDALAIAFADWAETYQIVDRMGIRILRDPFTAKPWIKFYTTKRTGGDLINGDSIKLLQFGSA